MSAEDLEIHQFADPTQKNEILPLKSPLSDELDSLLQRGKSSLCGGSLPILMNISSHPNGGNDVDAAPEKDTEANNHK